MFSAPIEPENWRQWRDASTQPNVDQAIRELYRDIDAAVTERNPTCWASGKCCNFGAYGHRLFVTGLEIAWFLRQAASPAPVTSVSGTSLNILPSSANEPAASDDADTCPFQIDGLCSTHTIRPLGCRLFFCQEGTQDWQQAQYEHFLAALQQLHQEFALDYQYVDWMAGLRQAKASGAFPAHG